MSKTRAWFIENRRLILFFVVLLCAMSGFAFIDGSPDSLAAETRAIRHALDVKAISALIIAFMVFAAGMFLLRRQSPRLRLIHILIGTVALSLPLFFALPLGSSDIFANAYNGNLLWFHRINPYVISPDTEIHDLVFQLTHAAHPFQTTYGPLWVTATGILAPIINDRPAIAMALYRIIALIALLVLVVFLSRLLRGAKSCSRALLLFAWNPFVLYEAVNNAHNDIFLALCVIAALVFLQQRKAASTLLLLTAGGLIKYISLIFFPLALAILFFDRKRVRRRNIIYGTVLSLIFMVVAFAPYWSGAKTFHGLFLLSVYTVAPLFSPLELLRKLLALFSLGIVEIYAIVRFFGFAVLATILFLEVLHVKKTENPNVGRLALISIGSTMACTLIYFQPWYFLWVLPLLFFIREKFWIPLTLILSALAISMYPF